MMSRCLIVGALSLLLPFITRSQKLSQADSVINILSAKLKDQYVFKDKGTEFSKKLTDNLKSGKYKNLTNEKLAQALDADLQNWSNDKHLHIGYSAEVLPDVKEMQTEIPAQEKQAYAEYLRHDNYGIAKLDVLNGNIGYINFKYLCTPEFAGDSYAAMMNYLAGTYALIIDLRQCGGATSPDAIPFICSYLFDKPTHLNDLYWRKNDNTTQAWTYAYVPGKKFLDKPVYVLTSNSTFSGAEELAYDLKNLKRATIIGGQTGGGANPGGDITLTPHFRVFMPSGRAINPITKTNWEGIGVEPDTTTNPAKALYVANIAALNSIKNSTKDEGWKIYLSGVITETEKNQPVFKTVTFELKDFENAKKIFVAGTFNGGQPQPRQ